MNNPQDDHPDICDFEDGTVLAEQQVAIGCSEDVIFRCKGTALQGRYLLFQTQNKGCSRIRRVILSDIIPDAGYISLSGSGNINSVCSCQS